VETVRQAYPRIDRELGVVMRSFVFVHVYNYSANSSYSSGSLFGVPLLSLVGSRGLVAVVDCVPCAGTVGESAPCGFENDSRRKEGSPPLIGV